MKIKIPIKGVFAEIRNNDLVVSFREPCNVLSSGLLNAGFLKAHGIVNHHVECANDCSKCKNKKPAGDAAKEVVRKHGLPCDAVILMTAADMKNLCKTKETFKGLTVAALITAGTSNATRAGEPARWHEADGEFKETGTINIIILTNGRLNPRAMVGSIITATEAKTAALYELGVKSRYSGGQATGTGTDGIAIASSPDGMTVSYAGAHSKFGEMVGRVVYDGVLGAIEKQDGIKK
jgi:adenosylcobinamide amidohydrolase